MAKKTEKLKSSKQIVFYDKALDTKEIKKILVWPVKEWFEINLKEFTPPQKISIPLIHKGENVLISSPTGSGKTLSAFFAIINELVDLFLRKELKDKVYCVYVSPLRALNNDIEKNLQWPLEGIKKILLENAKTKKEKREIEKNFIRIAVRTSDTTQSKKSSMLKKPPHILITTPESLAIMLNSPKFREKLENVKYAIVDELHALADNKRGTHLILSLERLSYLVKEKGNKDFVRIGLSATVNPLEEVAKFLFGNRKGKIIDVNYIKETDLKVLSPFEDFLEEESLIQRKLYDLLDELISTHKTTVIFTNTRSGAESVAFHLKQFFPKKYNEENIEVHHSSLSREERLRVEDKLKKGLLKVVVSSSSLELGIDIGDIDLVILLSSPKSVNRALQRVGRSGHKLHEKSKGRFIALDWDDLVENTILVYDAVNKKLDKVYIPKNCLDVLIQHLLGMALEKEWKIEEAFNLITSTYPYKDLSKEDFIDCLKYLANDLDYDLEKAQYYGKIYLDLEEGVFRARKGKTRIIYFLNQGVIPDEASIAVIDRKTKKVIGKVEEEFADMLRVNDVFVLAGRKWKFISFKRGKIYVEDAKDQLATIPAWFSEQLPLSFDLALDIQEFRDEMSKLIKTKGKEEIVKYLMDKFNLNENSANSIFNYFFEQNLISQIEGKNLLVEHFKKKIEGKTYYFYVFHSLIGMKANRALAYYLAEKIKLYYQTIVNIHINDNGFAFSFEKPIKLNEEIVEQLLNFESEEEFKKTLTEAIWNSFLVRRIFRHVATRSFLILRRYLNKKRSVEQQFNLALSLIRIMPFIPPLKKETFREIFEDKMDIGNLFKYLRDFRDGKRKVVLKRIPFYSPFSLNIIEGDRDIVSFNEKQRVKSLYKEIREYIKNLNK